MKAISIRQPWANMVFHTGKCVEVRNLLTNYRGLLAIQAGEIQNNTDFLKLGIDPSSIPSINQKCLIGVVNLIDIRQLNETLWEELRDKHQIPGRWNEFKHKYAWFFEDPFEIEPIPYKGLPSLFSLDPNVVDQFVRVKE